MDKEDDGSQPEMTRPTAAPSGMTAGGRGALLCASLVLGSLGASACGGGSPGQPATQERSDAKVHAITIALNEENRSGHTGKAILQPGESGRAGLGGGSGEGLRVTVTLSTDTGERNHAHVHDVTCAEYRNLSRYSEQLGTVVDTLRDLVGGQSDTVVRGAAVADRTTGRFSINVHKQAHPYDVIACGDIPRR
jgi:hypothetical protein